MTEYENDLIGRRTKEISADRGEVGYLYDLANNVTEIADGRGITAVMTYDELERVSTKAYPNTIAGKVEDVTYTYDVCLRLRLPVCPHRRISGHGPGER
ncbi:MAG: hypothetical protein E2O36_01975 [Proteobacteria bacterium]|nr:MAG: hypothetical protein E2O36_01975 [Pseudomonadota bacterium]